MSQSVNEYRLKIKKLKYKIEKEQQVHTQLASLKQQLKQISKAQLSIQSVINKIHFLLANKGMTITDWVNASQYPYDQNANQIKLADLISNLERMGIKLQPAEKSIFMNNTNTDMAQKTNLNEIISMAKKCGIRAN